MANPIASGGIGVMLEEIQINIMVINSVDIDALCIIGKFERGPINKPVEFNTFNQFEDMMGKELNGYESWIQAYIFFEFYNGRRLVCIRVANYTDITDSSTLTATKATANLDDNESISDELSGDIDDTITTIPLVDASRFPESSTGGAYILIGSEQITWTGKTGNDLTGATRGANGTTAASHTTGDAVTYSEPSLGAIVEAKWAGDYGNNISIKVEETTTIEAETQADLEDGDTEIELDTVAGIEVGDVISIDDTAYVQITSIVGRVVKFSAVSLTGTITSGSTVYPLRNTISIYYDDILTDNVYENVSVYEENKRYYIETLLESSNYIKLEMDTSNQSEVLHERRLKATSSNVSLTGGSDGTALTETDYAGHSTSKTGVYALDYYKKPVVITCPDSPTVVVQREIASYCLSKIIHAFVFDFSHGLTITSAKYYSDKSLALTNEEGSFGTWYWPNIKIQHPTTKEIKQVKTSGSVVGAWARVSGTPNLGPWQVAAGDYGILVGVRGLETVLSNGEQVIPTDDDENIKLLQDSHINPIIYEENTGYKLFGSLTMDRRDPQDENAFTHINQRETFRLVEATFKDYFRKVLFRNNTQDERNRVLQISNKYLSGLFVLGAFPTETADEAYGLKCDSENNTRETIKDGWLILDVELTKHTPINRVKLRFMGKVQQ